MKITRIAERPCCFTAVAGLGIALAIAPVGGVRAASMNDPADLGAINAIEEALQSPASAAALAANYTPDATVLGAIAPGIQRGRAQIAAAFAQRGDTPTAHQVLESSIVSDGTMACDALEVQTDWTDGKGVARRTQLRRLDMFTKVDGNWLIAQEQVSAAADRKTGASLLAGPVAVRGAAHWQPALFNSPALDQGDARAQLRRWVDAALRVIGIGQAMSFFDPRGNVLLYGEFAPGNLRSAPEIHDYYAGIMGSYTTIDVVNPVLEVASDGVLGAQIDTQDLVLHLNDGTTRPIFIRQSDCLRRAGGRWHSFMEMVSFPADKDTGQAVMQPRAGLR